MYTTPHKLNYPSTDLPILCLTDEDIRAAAQMAALETPAQTVARLQDELGLPRPQVELMLKVDGAVDYFEAVIRHAKECDMQFSNVIAFNWMTGDLLGIVNSQYDTLKSSKISPIQFAKVLQLFASTAITGTQTKALLQLLSEENYLGREPQFVVEAQGWKAISHSELMHLVDGAIKNPANEKQLKKYIDGKDSFLNFFLGEVMRATKGSVDPKYLREIIKTNLDQYK